MQKFKVDNCSTENTELNFNDRSTDYSRFVQEEEKHDEINLSTFKTSLLKMKQSEINVENISTNTRGTDDNKNKEAEQTKSCSVAKLSVSRITKEAKSKYGLPNKSSTYNRISSHPLAKRKYIPSASHLTNTSAKIVLSERNVQIKDLESKVRYLQDRIKELDVENKTLHDVQSRQQRELKKFKEGVADIPSLLRCHKQETKALESTIFTLRKELKDCQKEIKSKNEIILKKDYHIDKQNSSLKQNEKIVQDMSHDIKELKVMKLKLEEENKKLLDSNENLKFETEDLQKKIKEMVYRILKLEENLNEENNLNKQLTEEIKILQRKYEAKEHNKILMLDKDTSYNSPIEDLLENLNSLSNEASSELENKQPEELSIIHDNIIGKLPEKIKDTDKTKEALIHTFKWYEDICNSESNKCTGKSSVGNVTNNIKVLPPLKQTVKKYSQNSNCLLMKEQFFLSVDNNIKLNERKKSSVSKELLTDFHHRLKMHDTEIVSGNGRFTQKIDKCNIFDESSKQSSVCQQPVSWFENL